MKIDYNNSIAYIDITCKATYDLLAGTTTCVLTTCGNGLVDIGEQCDDTNRISNDGCTYDCLKEVCPDLQERRRKNDTKEICALISCGNGILEIGEECDDTNKTSDDGCSLDCKKEVCPDQQERRRRNDTKEICVAIACGNGLVETGEECDDTNKLAGDGCSIDCKKETCPATQERRRRTNDTMEICVSVNCGNAVIETGEECDDTNKVSGDGCSFDCKIEPK